MIGIVSASPIHSHFRLWALCISDSLSISNSFSFVLMTLTAEAIDYRVCQGRGAIQPVNGFFKALIHQKKHTA